MLEGTRRYILEIVYSCKQTKLEPCGTGANYKVSAAFLRSLFDQKSEAKVEAKPEPCLEGIISSAATA